jgi:hypothetical protein
MPKTKTLYSKQKKFLLSDKGNQMLSDLWRINESDSEAQFIRDAIVFYMIRNMEKIKVSKYIDRNIQEVNDFYQNLHKKDLNDVQLYVYESIFNMHRK